MPRPAQIGAVQLILRQEAACEEMLDALLSLSPAEKNRASLFHQAAAMACNSYHYFGQSSSIKP